MLSRFWLLSATLLLTGACGCQTLVQRPPQRFEHLVSRDQLILHSDVSLEQQEPLVDELVAQRQWLTEKLRHSATEVPIHIYLFEDEASYTEFIEPKFPDFASRRALFVETGDELAVYAYRGEHIAVDLRHEVSHGYLHAAVPNLPFWLDEGLAEYFEVGEQRHGLNRDHAHLLRQKLAAGQWQPDLMRLEQLGAASDMTQLEYAESWAWVHLLLESEPEQANLLLDYLADLRHGGAGALLSTQLQQRLADPEVALLAHLDALR